MQRLHYAGLRKRRNAKFLWPYTKLCVSAYDASLHKRYEEYLLSLNFKEIGVGAYRRVFKRGNIVIKVPKHWDGFEDNIAEAYVWRKYRNSPNENGIIFAPARLLPNACLMMVFVEPLDCSDLPEWAFQLDALQAGYYKGRYVAYDSGLDTGADKNEALRSIGLNEE